MFNNQRSINFIMKETAASFIAKSTVKAADLDHRRKINFNISRYNAVVPQGKQQFKNVMLARERAKNAKWRAIENIDAYLEEFEKRMSRNCLNKNLVHHRVCHQSS